MYDILLNHIKETYPTISDDDFNMIIRSITLKKYVKKTILWKENDYVKEAGFVINGCFRYFNTNENGYERNTHFAMDNWWIGDMYGMLNTKPAKQSCQALEDSNVLSITKEGYKNLLENCTAFRRFTRIKRDRAYDGTLKELAGINEPAEIRYKSLIKRYPKALFRIPMYHIASYLAITPESLSRLRKILSSSEIKK